MWCAALINKAASKLQKQNIAKIVSIKQFNK